jgi:hypothetical protein
VGQVVNLRRIVNPLACNSSNDIVVEEGLVSSSSTFVRVWLYMVTGRAGLALVRFAGCSASRLVGMRRSSLDSAALRSSTLTRRNSTGRPRYRRRPLRNGLLNSDDRRSDLLHHR